MKKTRALMFSVNILRYSKLRSWLTIIGIVIGVAAIVAIVSVGTGLQVTVERQLGGLGADIITITPGFSRAQGFGRWGERSNNLLSSKEAILSRKDVQIMRSIPGIDFINPTISKKAEITYLGEKADVNIQGVDSFAWSNIITTALAEGRYLGPADSNVIVITNSLSKDIFKNDILINKPVTINDKLYRVVGILEEEGFTGSNTAYMPIFSARSILDNDADQYDSIVVKIADPDKLDSIISAMENRMMISRHITEDTKDFTITSSKAIQQQISQILGTFTLFLTAIAAISLLVGAVGIANTMFTSVLEKTKEIGILKAIGAKNSDIMTIFLFNSVLLGLVGGVVGVLLGYLGSQTLAFIIPISPGMNRLTPIITPEIVIIALAVSMMVGIISGVIPAYRASKLKPADSLRYE